MQGRERRISVEIKPLSRWILWIVEYLGLELKREVEAGDMDFEMIKIYMKGTNVGVVETVRGKWKSEAKEEHWGIKNVRE